MMSEVIDVLLVAEQEESADRFAGETLYIWQSLQHLKLTATV